MSYFAFFIIGMGFGIGFGAVLTFWLLLDEHAEEMEPIRKRHEDGE